MTDKVNIKEKLKLVTQDGESDFDDRFEAHIIEYERGAIVKRWPLD